MKTERKSKDENNLLKQYSRLSKRTYRIYTVDELLSRLLLWIFDFNLNMKYNIFI